MLMGIMTCAVVRGEKNMESNILFWIIGAAGGFALMAVETLLMRAFFRTPPPHRLLVVSGRQYPQGGKTRGFAVHGRTR
jgi:hypothetical protein